MQNKNHIVTILDMMLRLNMGTQILKLHNGITFGYVPKQR